MKRKEGFNIREICGENIIVAEGLNNIDFTNVISMNETSAYLWNCIEGIEFDAEFLAEKLQEQYEVDATTALKDSQQLIEAWRSAKIIE